MSWGRYTETLRHGGMAMSVCLVALALACLFIGHDTSPLRTQGALRNKATSPRQPIGLLIMLKINILTTFLP